jgi:hypothetical protein
MTTLEKVLTALEDYGLGYRTRVGTFSFSTITVAGTTATINIASTSGALAGMYVYVTYGQNEGFHLITSVTATTIVYEDADAVAQSVAGSCIVYNVKTKAIQGMIDRQTAFIERQVNVSLSGVTEYTEWHDGSGTSELMLDRKNINALVSIQVITQPNWQFSISSSGIDIIPGQGMLRCKAATDMEFQARPPLFPKGENNIKVTYTAGYASMPADLQQALQLLTQADVLGDAAAQAGDAASINVVAWSRSWSNPRGQYGNIRNQWYSQAMHIIRNYGSGVVGN